MQQYDPKDLQSSLVYIKQRFGPKPFLGTTSVAAYLADLAPGLKKERNMIDRMDRLGILKDFMEAANKDEITRKRVYAKSLTLLTDVEYIRDDVAENYLSIIAATFEWADTLCLSPTKPEKQSAETVRQTFSNKQHKDIFGSEVVPVINTDSASSNTSENCFQRIQKEESDRLYQSGKHLFRCGLYEDAKEHLAKRELAENSMAQLLLGRIYGRSNDLSSQAESMRRFMTAVKLGNPLADAWLADFNRSREEYSAVKQNVETLASSGIAEAQYLVGHANLYGTLYPQDFQKALDWLEKASKQGDCLAKFDIVSIYYKGLGVPKDEDKAIRILKQCSVSADPEINLALGNAYLLENSEDSKSRAYQCLLRAANAGLAEAQSRLAILYHEGIGVKQSDEDAARWMKKAADNGDAFAQYNLGHAYQFGEGVARDFDLAFKYYRLSANQNYRGALYMLHQFYLDPDYKEPDINKGVETLQKAAEAGEPRAYIRLAECYYGEYGVPSNPRSHFYWAKKAAEADIPKGQRFLGVAYLDMNLPDVFRKDDKKGFDWLNIAWRNGDQPAYVRLVKFHAEHKEMYTSSSEMEEMFKKANQILEDMDEAQVPSGQEHLWLAAAVDNWFESDLDKRLALDHYCEAYKRGKGSSFVLTRIAEIHFLSGVFSDHLKTSDATSDAMWEKEIREVYQKSKVDARLLFTYNQMCHDHMKTIDAYWVKEIREECQKSVDARLLFAYAHICYWARGTEKNWREAVKLAEKASDLGSTKASLFLAKHYLNSSGSEPQAFEYAKKAYDRGSQEAIRLLGICYDSGYGVSRDRAQAKRLFTEASVKGDKKADELLKKRSFFGRFKK